MNSGDIKSSGIHAVNAVSAAGGDVTCESVLRAGGTTGTYIDLDDGDALYCNGVRMTRQGDVFGQITYKARVPSNPRAIYEIKFVRAGETLVAGAMMPSPITGAAIVGGNSQRIGSSFTVTWDRSAYADESTTAFLMMSDSSDRHYGSATAKDPAPELGRATFAAGDTEIRYFDSRNNRYERVSGPYSSRVELRREKIGAMTGAWKGSMSAVQSSSLDLRMVD